jgi:hypothetical protein
VHAIHRFPLSPHNALGYDARALNGVVEECVHGFVQHGANLSTRGKAWGYMVGAEHHTKGEGPQLGLWKVSTYKLGA